MDPPTLMNGSSSSYQPASAAASYNNLTEIWPFPISGGGGGDSSLGMSLAPFRPDLTQFDDGCGGLDRMSTGSEPMGGVVEQRQHSQRGGAARKRREASAGADEDGKAVSTTSSGNALNDLESKRLRSSGSKDDHQNSKCDEGNSGMGLDKSSKPPPEPPKDYIHVRARRGQATDSHSLAERARREKISERMKILQDLVPGCNKVIGKALVLDEIINYVQSLQRQVEFLSMKLEAVNSRINLGMEGYPSKDFGQQAFDPSGIPYGSEPMREYSRGTSPEWLHMQLGGGGGLDRQT